jgi:hypothetical protein
MVTLGEVRLAVTPTGADTARSTVPVKPFSGVTVIVEEPEVPMLTGPIVEGLAVTLKSATETEPVRHWLGVAEQSTIDTPVGSLTCECSDGVLT